MSLEGQADIREVPWKRSFLGVAFRAIGTLICGICLVFFMALIIVSVQAWTFIYFDMPQVGWFGLAWAFGLFLRWLTRPRRAFIVTAENGAERVLIE